jgi:hypothetical protein
MIRTAGIRCLREYGWGLYLIEMDLMAYLRDGVVKMDAGIQNACNDSATKIGKCSS